MKIIDWFRGLFTPGKEQRFRLDGSDDLIAAYNNFRVRELAFWCCVNMVANAVARCEFRTFQGNKEIRGAEYYMWNIDPSRNESSTAFLHKFVANAYRDNEALLIFTKNGVGRDGVVVADSWEVGEEHPTILREYKGVVVGDTTYRKTFREDEVIHFKLNNANMVPIIEGLTQSFEELMSAAAKTELWKRGQHWKVHIDSTADGVKDQEKFKQILNDQFKPFLNSVGAVLPEFTGYKYENVSSQAGSADTRDIRALFEDVFDLTARGFNIPIVLSNGKVEATGDANTRFLTMIDGCFCDQLSEEITRKRYGYDGWKNGDYLIVDSSSIMHYDIFKEAAAVEKLVGSGAYSVNDVRRASGQTIINEPWADEHYLTKNIGTMAENARALEKGDAE